MTKLPLLAVLALAALPTMLGAAVPPARGRSLALGAASTRAVPEPAALACLAVGALGLRRRAA